MRRDIGERIRGQQRGSEAVDPRLGMAAVNEARGAGCSGQVLHVIEATAPVYCPLRKSDWREIPKPGGCPESIMRTPTLSVTSSEATIHNINIPVVCPLCDGTGERPILRGDHPCPHCGGRKTVDTCPKMRAPQQLTKEFAALSPLPRSGRP